MRNLKKVLSLSLALVMLLGMMVVGAGAAEFPDAGLISANKQEAVDVMAALGVFKGDETGALNPQETLTREMAATIVCNMLLDESTIARLEATSAPFTDVAVTDWSAKYIAWCKTNGFIAGRGDGTFGPKDELTNLAFATIMLRVLGYKDGNEGWQGTDAPWAEVAASINSTALRAGLLTNIDMLSSEQLNRENAVQMTFNVLTADMVEYSGGTNITIGDTVITQGGTRSVMVNNKTSYKTTDTVNASFTGTMQFCEQYFVDLKLTDNATDSFGRVANQWTVKNVEVAKTANGAATFTYTAVTEKKDIEAAMRNVTTVNTAEVYTNGYKTSPAYASKDAAVTAIQGMTGNGKVVELYINGATLEKVVVVNYVLAQVTKVDEKKGENTYVTVASEGAYGAASRTLTSKTGFGAYAKDDYVILAASSPVDGAATLAGTHTVQEVYAATKVTGYATTVNATKATVVVGGQTYTAASNIETAKKIDGSFAPSAQFEATLYLDQYGFVVRAEAGAAGDSGDGLIAVTDVYTTLDNGKLVTRATGVNSKGETVDVQIQSNAIAADFTNKICTYNEGTKTLTVVTKFDATTATAPVVADKFFAVEDITVAAGATNYELTYNTSSTEKYYFASNVKFVFVDGGKATVLDGVQAYNDLASANTKTAFVLGKVGDDTVVTAVLVEGKPSGASAVTSDETIFVVGSASPEKTVVADASAPGGYKTVNVYTAYQNGVAIENFTSEDAVASNGFYGISIKENGTYVLNAGTQVNELATSANAVMANQTVSATFGGIYLTANSIELNAQNATFVGIGAGAPTSVAEIAEARTAGKTVTVWVLYNANTKIASYVYVSASGEGEGPGGPAVGSAKATCTTAAATFTNKTAENGKVAPSADITVTTTGNGDTADGTGTIALTIKSGGQTTTTTDTVAFELNLASGAEAALKEAVDGVAVGADKKTVTLTCKDTSNGWASSFVIVVTNGTNKVEYTATVTVASTTIGAATAGTVAYADKDGSDTLTDSTATVGSVTNGAADITIDPATSGTVGAGDTLTVEITVAGTGVTVQGEAAGTTKKSVTLTYDGEKSEWSTATVVAVAPAGNTVTYTVKTQ